MVRMPSWGVLVGGVAVLVAVWWLLVSSAAPAGPAGTPGIKLEVTAVTGTVAPMGQRPAATATPSAVYYRGAPYGPVKIDPRAVQQVKLGHLEVGVLVRAVVTVAFNNRLSNVSGVPDVDVAVRGPVGEIASYPMARSGTAVSFTSPLAGEYTIEMSNARSRVNAKQVSLQFLQP